jgi:ATP-dependent helicase/DNAse subunit B
MKHPKAHYQDLEPTDGFKWAGWWDGFHHFTKMIEGRLERLDAKRSRVIPRLYTEVRALDEDIENGNLTDMIKLGVTR